MSPAEATSPASPPSGTFRDPQGTLYQDGDRMLRRIYPEHAAEVSAWIQSPLARRWMDQGRMVRTEVLEQAADGSLLLEHERIAFPTYPWEWTPGQWQSAALLTLDLCSEAVAEGYVLKDATPLNVLFAGPRPVFVDVLSFDRREPTNPIWLAYAQFVRTFLLPLAAFKFLGWPLVGAMQRRDGYEPADLAPWLGPVQKWREPLRSLVSLPLALQSRSVNEPSRPRSYERKVAADIAGPILQRTLRSARKKLLSLTPNDKTSRWSNYTETATHYTSKDQQEKQDFVRRTLEACHPARVLDVGANTGVFSRIAASAGAQVVAWDSDVRATDLNWEIADRDKLAILPVIADFARPTPAVGWRNSECASLLTRGQGHFDCVLMLGVLHHLLLSDQIPLPQIIDQVAELTQRWAILEWIPQSDVQFISVCRGREALYAHLDEGYLKHVLSARFRIIERHELANCRTLFFIEKIQ